MIATGALEQNALDHSAESWAAGVVSDMTPKGLMTVGLTSGSRNACDHRAVTALARVLHDALSDRYEVMRPMLVVRLKVMVEAQLERAAEQAETGPSIVGSHLGGWSEVTVPVPLEKRSWSREHMPYWMSAWKRDFRVMLVDLGPISEVPSRVIGRLCDGCYILLGPETCGSRDWILRHVAWHQHSGSTICGTLVIDRAS